jgi:exopolysaccharide production protein ExoZ
MLIYIQILRFFAAAAVVAFHAFGVAPNFIAVPEGAPSYGLQYGGHGVDLFFAISGFIIFYATHRAKLTPAMFLRRRIERIVPVYFFVTFAVIALAIVFPATFGTPGWITPRHVLKSLGFVSFTDGEMPVVYVGWSLEYEMYFYLAVALLMALKRETWRSIVVIFSILTIIGQIPGGAGALGNYSFFVDPLIMEFALGVLIGCVFVNGRVGMTELIAAACAIATLLVTDPGNRAIVIGIPSAAAVAAAAYVSLKRPKPSFVEKVLERLGDASYSIYLAQVNTVSLACRFMAGLVPDIAPMALVLVATTVVVLAGLLLNIAVERPLLRLSRRLAAPRLRNGQPTPASGPRSGPRTS